MSVSRIKKNDTVIAVAGSHAGKSGKVLQVDAARGRVLVEGLNLVKKALRKSQDNPQGGIVEKEASITAANLMLFCPTCKKGVRIARSKDGDRSVRNCRICRHSFDS